MKISILLPYKENFSPSYAGAVSLFINDTLKISKYKSITTVYGNTEYINIFKLKYKNINLKKIFFQSQNKKYVEEFIKIEKKTKSNLIELHNRPIYLKYLTNKLKNKTYILYFHNDPLTMNGSKKITDRIFLMKNCFKIIFNSNWSKRRFLEGMRSDYLNSDKLIVINQSAKKNKIDIKKKDWKSIVIGDEPRDQLEFNHKNLIKLGFLKHNHVLDIYKKTSIAVVCSRWEEPFGRTSLEASSNACAVIISNRGGLPETITNGVILKNLNIKNVYKEIDNLIIRSDYRLKLQKLSKDNFFLTHKYVSNLIDQIRDQILLLNKKIFTNISKKSLRILHITNFNERHNGRLFFNTGRRINNGFIRLGNSVLEFSDRDIQKHYKSYSDFSGAKSLNDKLRKTCYNYKPDIIIL